VGGAVTEVVAFCKVTAVLCVAFFFYWEIEVCLADIVLALDFVLCESMASDAEEACLVDL
jgi:hypothetical protein